MIYRLLLALLILPVSHSIGSQLIEVVPSFAHSEQYNCSSSTLSIDQIDRVSSVCNYLAHECEVENINFESFLPKDCVFIPARYQELSTDALEVSIMSFEARARNNRLLTQPTLELTLACISAHQLRKTHTFRKPTPPIQKVAKSSSSTSTTQKTRRPVTRSQSRTVQIRK